MWDYTLSRIVSTTAEPSGNSERAMITHPLFALCFLSLQHRPQEKRFSHDSQTISIALPDSRYPKDFPKIRITETATNLMAEDSATILIACTTVTISKGGIFDNYCEETFCIYINSES
ncbi:hypothetical protein CEXT_587081 [Caerostris extrusa]|uniref:Uncharacterized protein n=1 Tax=Caerostris extrusa TaxID=172846 RepID=A0AAV4RV09_CAEEX|nr:hypothetical protein CEXT_587081 [Caerostris extrusa]